MTPNSPDPIRKEAKPICSQCGRELPGTQRVCRHCGPETFHQSPPPPQKASWIARFVVRFILLFVSLGILVLSIVALPFILLFIPLGLGLLSFRSKR